MPTHQPEAHGPALPDVADAELEGEDVYELQDHEFTLEPEETLEIPPGPVPEPLQSPPSNPPLPRWAAASRALLDPWLNGDPEKTIEVPHSAAPAKIPGPGISERAARERLQKLAHRLHAREVYLREVERALAVAMGRVRGQGFRIAELEEALTERAAGEGQPALEASATPTPQVAAVPIEASNERRSAWGAGGSDATAEDQAGIELRQLAQAVLRADDGANSAPQVAREPCADDELGADAEVDVEVDLDADESAPVADEREAGSARESAGDESAGDESAGDENLALGQDAASEEALEIEVELEPEVHPASSAEEDLVGVLPSAGRRAAALQPSAADAKAALLAVRMTAAARQAQLASAGGAVSQPALAKLRETITKPSARKARTTEQSGRARASKTGTSRTTRGKDKSSARKATTQSDNAAARPARAKPRRAAAERSARSKPRKSATRKTR